MEQLQLYIKVYYTLPNLIGSPVSYLYAKYKKEAFNFYLTFFV